MIDHKQLLYLTEYVSIFSKILEDSASDDHQDDPYLEVKLEETKGSDSIKCSNCGEVMEPSAVASHTVTCYRNSIKCKVCGERVSKTLKSQHLNEWRSDQKIIESIEKDSEEQLTLVIDHGVNPEYVISSYGKTMLHLCAEKNSNDCLLLLISRGADTDPVDDDEKTPLLLSIEKGNTKVAISLIELGANIDAK